MEVGVLNLLFMKPILKITACVFLSALIFFVSCRKVPDATPSTPSPASNNKPPIANAGPDQTITIQSQP